MDSEDERDVMNEERTRELLGLLQDPPSPMSAEELLARHGGSKRNNPGRWIALAAAAVLLLGVGLSLRATGPSTDLTPRGLGDVSSSVELRYAVEGAALRRGGGQVDTDERLVFQARAGDAGYLCLLEQAPGADWVRILPRGGEHWTAVAGDNVVVDAGEPQSWRPDGSSGLHRYRLLLDADDPQCGSPVASDQIEVDWLP